MILDLFAGPGGWDVAAHDLGFRPVGVEHDAAACATRAAAGHLTIRQDVSTLDTARFQGLEGLIASPPCPTFSAAGKGEGREEMPLLIAHVHACADGWKDYDAPEGADPRSRLVLEPLRFILECSPTWVALEQVPDVLPVWEAYRIVMGRLGYSVWCGVLNAADYGVPQTRRRAILMASRERVVSAPEPTHCQGGAVTMFGELLPWVSMAEALGWGATDVPTGTVTGTGSGWEFGHGARDALERERERPLALRFPRGAGVTERHGERPDTPVDEPAPTVTGKARSMEWVLDRRQQTGGPGGGSGPCFGGRDG